MKKKTYSFLITAIIMLTCFSTKAEDFLETYIHSVDISNYPTVEFYLIIHDFEGQETIIGEENCKNFDNPKCYSIDLKENNAAIDFIQFKHYKVLDKNTEVIVVRYTSHVSQYFERTILVKISTPGGIHNYEGDSFTFGKSDVSIIPVKQASTSGFDNHIYKLFPPKKLTKEEIEGIVKEIRIKYGKIQSELNTYKKTEKEYTIGGGSGTVTTYYNNDDLRKQRITFDGDGSSGLNEYFYFGNNLFFIFEKWESFQLNEEETDVDVNEDRLYFEENRLIRWLVKVSKDDYKPHYKSWEDEKFKNKEIQKLMDSKVWLDFAKSKHTDFDSYINER